MHQYGQQVYYPYAWRPAIDIAQIMPMIISLITVVMMFTMIIRLFKGVGGEE